jgi:hypothetical protein
MLHIFGRPCRSTNVGLEVCSNEPHITEAATAWGVLRPRRGIAADHLPQTRWSRYAACLRLCLAHRSSCRWSRMPRNGGGLTSCSRLHQGTPTHLHRLGGRRCCSRVPTGLGGGSNRKSTLWALRPTSRGSQRRERASVAFQSHWPGVAALYIRRYERGRCEARVPPQPATHEV